MTTVYDIFTPAVPAKETFVERSGVTERLVEALRTPGKQIILYGHSGTGKTTLIERKLFELYENHIVTSCTKGMTFEAVLLDAFDQLDPYYQSGSTGGAERSTAVDLGPQWAKISAARNALTASTSSRVLPPQLTVQNLARFAGAAKACWVLEDFHKLEPEEKIKLAQAMKMFMDTAKTYPDIKSVAVGAVGTAREVVQYDPEMRNRVAEIELPLMSPNEIAEIIRIGSTKLGVVFPDKQRQAIIRLSNGLPSVCHQLCLSACLAAGVEVAGANEIEITKEHLDKAVSEYVAGASDSIRDRFDRAARVKRTRKYDNYGLVLNALCGFDLEGATVGEIARTVGKMKPGYPQSNVARYLKILQSEDKGSVLRFDAASGKYSYSDPFVRSYALAYFDHKPAQSGSQARASAVEQSEFLRSVFAILEKWESGGAAAGHIRLTRGPKPVGE